MKLHVCEVNLFALWTVCSSPLLYSVDDDDETSLAFKPSNDNKEEEQEKYHQEIGAF